MQLPDFSKVSLRMMALPITIVIFLIILVILVKHLADSLKLAAQNTGRINQYLAAVPADPPGDIFLFTGWEKAGIIIGCFWPFPHVKGFIVHKDPEFIAKIQQF